MKIKKHIPNFITILNLLSGCVAIAVAFKGMLELSAYLIVLSAILDYMDGMLARLLKAYSELGKQLDSLADEISFGLAPGVILFVLMSNNPDLPEVLIRNTNIIPYIGFLIPAFSALRLAKFNIDPAQTDSFIGLPTPANALLIASFPLILIKANTANEFPFREFSNFLNQPYFLILITLLMSYLLVSKIDLFSMKFKNYNWKANIRRYILLIISVILLISFQFAAIPIIILLYIILSLLCSKKKHQEDTAEV